MIKIKIVAAENIRVIKTESGPSLLTILRINGYNTYAPCGGKGKCGKCMVNITDEGNVMSCSYYPDKNIKVNLPGSDEAHILTSQTEFLENFPFKPQNELIGLRPFGAAIDLGTTTVVLYFLNLLSGRIEKIASFLNPQNIYGADIISRINYCQEHENGLKELQQIIVSAINNELDKFRTRDHISPDDLERIIIVGNTTMLHLLLGEDPVPIALAPFKPKFTGMQTNMGKSTAFNINPGAGVITLPCISAFVGADIVAGLSVIKPLFKNYLFLDIGTNGEVALVIDKKIYTCAAAAGPAFEGATLSCGMGAVNGAVSSFKDQNEFNVIGNSEPRGICGSGIVDIVAYMLRSDLIDETGLLKEPFIVCRDRKIEVTQQDIREIQLAKSAIYSGIKILMNQAGVFFSGINALFLAGGFGNYININSAIEIGLLPCEMKDKIYPVGNSAGIGALQYLKSPGFEIRINRILRNSTYIELSDIDDFAAEFALNINFLKFGK